MIGPTNPRSHSRSHPHPHPPVPAAPPPPRRRAFGWVAAVAAGACLLPIASCSTAGSAATASTGSGSAGEADPASLAEVIADGEASPNARERAIRTLAGRISSGAAGDPAAAREAIKTAAWDRRAFHEVRTTAIDALAADPEHEDDTRRMLALMLPTESAWERWRVIEHVGVLAAERGWDELTGPMLFSWSRPSDERDDRDRPERRALERMRPDRSPSELAFDALAGRFATPRPIDDDDRRALWDLLVRTDETGEAARLLRGVGERELDRLGAGADLVRTLRRAASELGVTARTAEELAWVERLAAPEHAGFWARAAELAASLDDRQRAGLGVRHLAFLVWAGAHEPTLLALDERDLEDRLDARLEGEVVVRRRGAAGADGSFWKAREALNWGDALAATVLRRALDDAGLRNALFEQADDDFRDTTTEHGGSIEPASWDPGADPGAFVAFSYPPRPTQRFGDDRFVASEDLLRNSTTALAHFHFHAMRRENQKYAGPSVSDLEYARRFGRAALVLTSVGADRLNADFYSPAGVVLDLGVIERPD